MRLLITGFEPFGSRNINISWEVAKAFEGKENISVIQLPVSFSKAHKLVIEEMSKANYTSIIMLGETSVTSDFIRLERIAINLKDAKSADNDGEIADEEPICQGSPTAFLSNFPIKNLCNNLNKEDFKIKISNSAGTFVCNCLYYNLLKHITENSLSTKALFIHFPASEESIDKEKKIKTVDYIINILNRDILKIAD